MVDSRNLFAAAPAPMLVVEPDSPHFTITDVNDAYLASVNRIRGDLVGFGLFEAFPDNPADLTATGTRQPARVHRTRHRDGAAGSYAAPEVRHRHQRCGF